MFYDAFSRGVLALVGDVLDAILLAYTFSGEGELKNVVEYVFVEIFGFMSGQIWVVQMFLLSIALIRRYHCWGLSSR